MCTLNKSTVQLTAELSNKRCEVLFVIQINHQV